MSEQTSILEKGLLQLVVTMALQLDLPSEGSPALDPPSEGSPALDPPSDGSEKRLRLISIECCLSQNGNKAY